MDLQYTIIFIRCLDELLLLNRNRPVWMGCWTGVGGKIEAGESARSGALREVEEETGLQGGDVTYKGVVTWSADGRNRTGGMYAYVVDFETKPTLETPIRTREGILDWKEIAWVFDAENRGIPSHVALFLPAMLNTGRLQEYHCTFENDQFTSLDIRTLPKIYLED